MTAEQMSIRIDGEFIATLTNESAEAPWTIENNRPMQDEINTLFSWAESSPGEPHIVEQAAEHYNAQIIVGPDPLVEGEIY